jgi:manganese transport protein
MESGARVIGQHQTLPWSRRVAGFSLREFWRYAGPAFLVSVGYMDPGNWGTDIEGGARFGYRLLWVILLSNLMAIFLQSLAAKLGIATGRTLAENCRDHLPRPAAFGLWATAEVAVIATDLAELLGGALGFALLFNLPLWTGALLTGALVIVTLNLYRYGVRVVEYVVATYLAIIGLSYLYQVALASPDWGAVASHMLIPRLNAHSVLVAVGILGATVMPHNLFLHSGLVLSRRKPHDPAQNRTLYRATVLDSVFALNLAWLVNSAILIMSAAVFHMHNLAVASIEEAHQTLGPLLGGAAGLAFAIALLCSGLSSSTTGTLAGQMVLEGFLRVRMPLWLRRLITMVPALAVIALGVAPLKALVLSQVVLSLQLPCTILPLIVFTSRKAIMGQFQNGPVTRVVAYVIAAVIIILNSVLLALTFAD